MSPGAPPRVSVVVPTCRRPALLARCLAALADQSLPAADFEVLVADDGGEEGGGHRATRAVIHRAMAAAPFALRTLETPGRRGPAAARNLGWRAARGTVIAFTDDDCLPDPGWLAAGLAAFAPHPGRPAVTAVAGRVVVPRPDVPTDYERNTARLEGSELVTANCFVRRATLAAVGGFDERFTLAWREDSDLHFTLLERGGFLARAQEAVVVHPIRPASFGVSLREQAKSRYNALLYKKHPALYRQRIQASPPWASYAHGAALLAAPAAAVAGNPGLAAAAAALWAGLTAWVCARRLRGTSHRPRHVAEMVLTSALIPTLSAGWRLAGAVRHRVLFL